MDAELGSNPTAPARRRRPCGPLRSAPALFEGALRSCIRSPEPSSGWHLVVGVDARRPRSRPDVGTTRPDQGVREGPLWGYF